MTPSHELLVVHLEQGVSGGEKLGMKDDFNPVLSLVEELDATNVAEDRVGAVFEYVVCADRRKATFLCRKYAPVFRSSDK